MTYPSLAELIAVIGGGGSVLGGLVGLSLRSDTSRRIAENVALGFGIGAGCGTAVGFAVYAGILIGRGLA